MKILLIGGTGTISTAITKRLSSQGHELYLLNRGSRNAILPTNIKVINVDINNEPVVREQIKDLYFDCVGEFIGFIPEQVERDFRLFAGKTNQYIYISSASAYHKPPVYHIITEGTSLVNPFWQYSRDKIACEDFLMRMYRENGFPVTIVRPSHTYDERSVPMSVHGNKGSYQVIKRMMAHKPVIIHGDGLSLWTMTHNSDFAKGYCGLIGNPHAIGEAFQITSDESLTWNQIYETIAKCLNVELIPTYFSSQYLSDHSDYDFLGSLIGDKANSVIFDNSKIKSIVPDFRCDVSFAQGIKQTLDYVLSHKECQIEDPEFDTWCDNLIK